jgi:hypothetical protein
MLILVALLALPVPTRAGGHRSEAAAGVAGVDASNLNGFTLSLAIPLCRQFLRGECANDWSVVASGAWLDGDHTGDEPGAVTRDTSLNNYLVGFRHTPWSKAHLIPFVQGLVGMVRTVEEDQVTRNEVLRKWGPAWAFTGGIDWEVPGAEELRLRVQYDTILHRVGEDVRFGHGVSAWVSVGWEHPH